MVTKKHAHKKARTREGLVFSRIDKQRVQDAAMIKKIVGAQVFEIPHNPLWVELTTRSREEGRDTGLASADVQITRLVGLGRFHSIYVGNEAVADFIEQSEVKASDGALISQAASDAALRFQNGLAIHLPSRKESVVVNCVTADSLAEQNVPKYFVGASPDHMVTVAISRGENISYAPFKRDGRWPESVTRENVNKEAWSIVLNLMLYMDAFPECVTDGPPDIVMGSTEGATQQVVRASAPIREVYERSRTMPHMRRGHFRVLKSERFTHKRFKAVFVKPAMVRGSASTVHEP